MGEILILSGISNSGKSTYAHKLWKENPEKYIVVNRDKLRELAYAFTEETIKDYYRLEDFNYLESQVTAMQDNLIDFWLEKKKTVIIDNTNLRAKYIKEFEKFDCEISLKFFDITLKEALTRNKSRKRKVAEEIIIAQYDQYINLRTIFAEQNDTK